MSEENIYAAPKSQLIDPVIPVSGRFYVVSPLKFRVMYYVTYGFYEVYWCWRNWQIYRRTTGEDLWPVPRAIFSIFFMHALFAKFDEAIGGKRRWNGPMLATAIVGCYLADYFLGYVYGDAISLADVISLGLLVVCGECLLQGQHVANEACGDPDGKTNMHFSALNIVFLVIGGLFTMAALTVMALSFFAPELLFE